jgi:hypothetical protein
LHTMVNGESEEILRITENIRAGERAVPNLVWLERSR